MKKFTSIIAGLYKGLFPAPLALSNPCSFCHLCLLHFFPKFIQDIYLDPLPCPSVEARDRERSRVQPQLLTAQNLELLIQLIPQDRNRIWPMVSDQ